MAGEPTASQRPGLQAGPAPESGASPQGLASVRARPLDGITVVSLEQAIAAPFCTRQLADLGARVIKIERPKVGDFARDYDHRVNGLSSHFVWTNRAKESLTLDVKHPRAAGILQRLLAKADVLVQNLAPGAAARLGLSFEALHPTLPKLIVCDISGYGDDRERPGPYREKKAYDLLIQSESGFLSVTGTKDEPAKAGCSIADIAAGMYGYTNILAALIQRGKTGEGVRLDISMLESMAEWMSFPMYYAYDGAPPPTRNGAAHATIYPYGPFPTGDRKTVMLGLQNEREWAEFCKTVLLDPAIATDERFSSNARRTAAREDLHAIIRQAFSSLTLEQVVARLEAAQIANASVNTMADLWAHPQLQARGRWTEVQTSVGPIPALLPPGAPEAFDARMDAVPALGQHTAPILAELGFSAVEIEQLSQEGAT
jgi:itaconate CoA-transferase